MACMGLGRKGNADLFCGDGILGNPPPVPEAIGQFEYGQNELALCGSALFQARLERKVLYRRRIGRRGGEVVHRRRRIRSAAPSVSVVSIRSLVSRPGSNLTILCASFICSGSLILFIETPDFYYSFPLS